MRGFSLRKDLVDACAKGSCQFEKMEGGEIENSVPGLESDVEDVERKVKVDGLVSEHMSSQTCAAVDYCETSLMRDSTVCSFQIYELKRNC